MTKRIIHHPVLGALDTEQTVTFTFNGKKYTGLKHESIAAALLANGIRELRTHEETDNPRGIYCNIGHCYECRVEVNGDANIRACLTPIEDGMIIHSGKPLPTPVKDWGKKS